MFYSASFHLPALTIYLQFMVVNTCSCVKTSFPVSPCVLRCVSIPDLARNKTVHLRGITPAIILRKYDVLTGFCRCDEVISDNISIFCF